MAFVTHHSIKMIHFLTGTGFWLCEFDILPQNPGLKHGNSIALGMMIVMDPLHPSETQYKQRYAWVDNAIAYIIINQLNDIFG